MKKFFNLRVRKENKVVNQQMILAETTKLCKYYSNSLSNLRLYIIIPFCFNIETCYLNVFDYQSYYPFELNVYIRPISTKAIF